VFGLLLHPRIIIQLYITTKLSFMTNSRPSPLLEKFWTLICTIHIYSILTISNTFNFTTSHKPCKKEKAEIFITLLQVTGCFCYLLPEVKTIRHNYIRAALLRHFKIIDFFLIWSIFCELICIMCIKNLQNALNSTDVFLLWYFCLHLLADNPAIFRVTFLL
jgi:hypothetical protein